MHSIKVLAVLAIAVGQAASYASLSTDTVENFPQARETDFDINNQQGFLAPILIPRVPGSEGSAKVRQHFADFFETIPAWKLQWQNSTSKTPLSQGEEVPFINLIATRDPPWVQNPGDVGRLTLVAHYDSRIIPEGFIGAIDSAAPCAMLMHVAKSIDGALTKKWEAMQAEGVADLEEQKGIQILLLDGEEAFMSWTTTDSVYGARSLAAEWEQTFHPAWSTYKNPLESIDMFVLLDLLGSAHQPVPSYFKTTHWAYQKLAAVETSIRQAGKMKTGLQDKFLRDAEKTDKARWLGGMIGDDHAPFLARGVEILHLIPYNNDHFPPVWHTAADDGEHLDMNTVLDWATLTTAFTAEWLELGGYMTERNDKKRSKQSWTDKSEL